MFGENLADSLKEARESYKLSNSLSKGKNYKENYNNQGKENTFRSRKRPSNTQYPESRPKYQQNANHSLNYQGRQKNYGRPTQYNRKKAK